jgi:hypothetical protein
METVCISPAEYATTYTSSYLWNRVLSTCFPWLPIVDAYRTICIAPTPEARAAFEAIREFGSAA